MAEGSQTWLAMNGTSCQTPMADGMSASRDQPEAADTPRRSERRRRSLSEFSVTTVVAKLSYIVVMDGFGIPTPLHRVTIRFLRRDNRDRVGRGRGGNTAYLVRFRRRPSSLPPFQLVLGNYLRSVFTEELKDLSRCHRAGKHSGRLDSLCAVDFSGPGSGIAGPATWCTLRAGPRAAFGPMGTPWNRPVVSNVGILDCFSGTPRPFFISAVRAIHSYGIFFTRPSGAWMVMGFTRRISASSFCPRTLDRFGATTSKHPCPQALGAFRRTPGGSLHRYRSCATRLGLLV